jgi:hypothetical protein
MKTKIYEDSKNYTCQVINLPKKVEVKGLDNLVEVNVQGNSCLIGKNSDETVLYLFFPAECQISHEFLSKNNLYRHSELNEDKTQKGFFEDNRRVKTLKFKGVISSGFVIPLESLGNIFKSTFSANWKLGLDFKIGDEFNEFDGIEICRKYIKPVDKVKGMSNPRTKVLDKIIDSKFAPEHIDTSHLMKNIHKLNLDDYISVTYKLHGTSARYYNAPVKRKLSLLEKVSKFLGANIQEEEFNYISASRRVIKGVGFETLPNKNHFFTSGDLWSEVGKEFFNGKLNKGEAIYCEIVGKTYSGEDIQSSYTYGFNKPTVFIYRISNINSQGIEIDLSYHQMKERATQLGIEVCPELFYGKLQDFINQFTPSQATDFDLEVLLNNIFYNKLLEKPSILDSSVIEEGFCLRIDKLGKPDIYKVKSKLFLLHEGHQLDKEVKDIEVEQE